MWQRNINPRLLTRKTRCVRRQPSWRRPRFYRCSCLLTVRTAGRSVPQLNAIPHPTGSCCPSFGSRSPHLLPRQHVQYTLSPTDVIHLGAHLQLRHGSADAERTASDTRWSSMSCSSTHAASAPGSMGRKLPVKTATACSAVVIE